MEKLSSVRLVSSVLVLMLLMTIEMGPNPMVAEASKANPKVAEVGKANPMVAAAKKSNPMVVKGNKLTKCESPSQKFKGLCFNGNNCASTCKTEGFHGGECRGLRRRRCFCTRTC